MINILIFGCGDVARRSLPWLTTRARVFAWVRNAQDAAELRRLGVRPLSGDLDQRQSLRRLKGLADIVLYCAPPASEGPCDDEPRLRRVMSALASQHGAPRAFIYISTTGVYGDCAGEWVTESRPVNAINARAQRRVSAERIVRAGAKRLGMRSAILRAPGIYAADRLPLARLQQKQAVLRQEDDVFTNHIHADDLARVLCLTAFRAKAGGRVYNVCDDTQMKMGDYFDLVADTFGLPRPPRASRAECEQKLSSMTMSFMSESRRLSNARFKKELRCSLLYADVFTGLLTARATTTIEEPR